MLSAYDPSELAVHVPETWRDPVTGADEHPKPTYDRSSVPDTIRHDEVAFHVPTRLPPHGTGLEHDAGAPLLLPLEAELPLEPELPPELEPLLELDDVPESAPPGDPLDVGFENDEHATARSANPASP